MMSKHFAEPGLEFDSSNRREIGSRIGLISPYTGSNLGDAAIIESALRHLRHLFTGAEFLLIVIDPARVSELHATNCVPLTAVPRSFYFTPSRNVTVKSIHASAFLPGDERSSRLRVRSLSKRVMRFIPLALPLARRLRNGFQNSLAEVRHLAEARRVVLKLNGLIVAGGGQFDDEFGGPWGHPYTMFKWINLARTYHVPVFFTGVGVCEIRHPFTAWFVRRTLSRATRVSLRDGGSHDILRKLEIRRKLDSCPDLAFGLQLDGDLGVGRHAAESSRFTIGLSPIAYGRSGSWPTERSALFKNYWKEFQSLTYLLLKANHNIKIFSTDDADSPLARNLYEQVRSKVREAERVQLLPPLKLSDLLTVLGSLDGVVASRLHGIILSHISAVPALGIAYHRKVQAHMKDMRQERFCLDFANFTASGALQSLYHLLSDRESNVSEIRHTCADRNRDVENEFAEIVRELDQCRGKRQMRMVHNDVKNGLF